MADGEFEDVEMNDGKLSLGKKNALVDAGLYFFAIIVFGLAIGLLLLLRKVCVKCNCGRYVERVMMTEIRRTLMFSSVIRMA